MNEMVGTISLRMHIRSDGARASLASVSDVLAASEAARKTVAQFLPDMVDAELSSRITHLFLDRGDLLFGEMVTCPASGALEIALKPAQWYLELVAAIAADGDLTCDFDFHGWPLLTLGSGVPSVTELAGASSLGQGGQS